MVVLSIDTMLYISHISAVMQCVSVTSLFHLALCSQGLSVLSHLVGFPLLRLNNIPLYVYSTFYLSIHLLIDTWVASINASMSMHVEISLKTQISFRYISRKGIGGSCSNSVFNFFEEPQ